MRATLIRLAPAVLVACLLSGGAVEAGQAPSAAHESARLQRVGVEAYVQELFADDPRYSLLLSGVEAGRNEWLRLAQDMKPAVDGAVAEDLDASLAKALINNPQGVLKLLSPNGGKSSWRIKDICGAPIPAPGKAWLSEYKAKAISAVGAVSDPGLGEQRRRCLQALGGIDLSKPWNSYE